MPAHFTDHINVQQKNLFVSVVPHSRADGFYYEINIQGLPRFVMQYAAIGRYDIVPGDHAPIDYEIILAVSDIIEKHVK
jgi:hypothetical protein